MRRVLTVFLFAAALSARADYREFRDVPLDPSIATKLRHAAARVLREFPKLKDEDLALSVVDVTRPTTISRGDYHGETPFYPASVVKLFYMVETYHRVKPITPEVERALKEMIVASDNDATAYLVDVISGTTAGPELEGRALNRFIEQRRVVNKHFNGMGYDISAMMKPWSFGPYGREKQLIGPDRINRNRHRANDVASLMLWIVRRRAPGAEAAMTLLARPLAPVREDENQVKEFIGEGLPAGSKLWSKAGWTSEVRHDAAYVELPEGRKLIVVIFTRGTAEDVTLIPGITKILLEELE